MPFVVPALLAAGVATGIGVATGVVAATAALTYFATSFAISVVISGISQALAKNAKNPEPSVQSGNRTVTIRQAISPWEAVLGRARKGGILTFRYISPDRKFWHMVITVACHKCEAIDQVWANDEVLALDSNGMAQGKWAKTVVVEDATEAVVPDPPSIFVVPTVTAVQAVLLDVNGDGIFWPLNEVAGTPTTIYEYAHPAPGHFAFHTGAIGKTAHIRTFNSTGNSYIRVKVSLGNESSTTQPFPDLAAESNGRWAGQHKQYGHTKVYIRLEANPDLFPFGVPNFSFVMRGANEVLDARTDLTGYTNNAALCTNWYLTNSEFGPGFDYATEVDEADLITAANDADTAVALAAGGSELRYTVNGSFSTSEQPKAVLERLLAACAGTLVDLGDKWRINMGVYRAPTVTLSETHLAGPSIINPYLPAREDANGVKGIFTNPNAQWQPDDFPAIEGVGYLAADGGKRKWKDVDFTAFVTSITQAQRLAKIELLKLRQPLAEETTFKLSAWAVVPGRSVARTDAQLGWNAKPFECLDSELVIAGDENPVLAVKLVNRETAAAIYDWSTSEEGFEDLAPNTNLPDVLAGLPVVTLTLSSGTADLFVGGDGTVVSRIRASWPAVENPFATRYETQFKRSSVSIWESGPVLSGGPGTGTIEAFLSPVEDGVAYDVRVRAVMSFHNGPWKESLAHLVVGKTENPPDVAGFTIQGAEVRWTELEHDNVPDLAGYRIRHQTGLNQSWGDAPQAHSGLLTSSPYTLPVLPSGQLTLMLKAVDTSGNESLNPALIITDLGDPLIGNIVEEIDFRALGFPGTKTNGTVGGGGNLEATSTTLMWKADDAASMWNVSDALLMWSASLYAQMQYEDRIVVTDALEGSTLTLRTTIAGDPWTIEYRENSTNPVWGANSGAVMWNAAGGTLMWFLPDWQPWPGQITVVDSLYDIRVTTGQGPVQGVISELVAVIDAPDILEFLNDVPIAADGTRLVLENEFFAIRSVNLTLQADGGSGMKAEVQDKNVVLGPLVKVFNTSNVPTTGLVDAIVKGY